jgi:AIPR protein
VGPQALVLPSRIPDRWVPHPLRTLQGWDATPPTLWRFENLRLGGIAGTEGSDPISAPHKNDWATSALLPAVGIERDNGPGGVAFFARAIVGAEGEELLTETTRFMNSQNAVGEKDFIALEKDFRTWAPIFNGRYGVFLEIQRGAWEARRAYQRQHPLAIPQYGEAANAFELLKAYAAGWLGEPGIASGKNPPFAPGGSDQHAPAENVKVRLELSGLVDLRETKDLSGWEVKVFSPDAAQPQFADISLNGNVCEFTLRRILHYTVVTLSARPTA